MEFAQGVEENLQKARGIIETCKALMRELGLQVGKPAHGLAENEQCYACYAIMHCMMSSDLALLSNALHLPVFLKARASIASRCHFANLFCPFGSALSLQA